MLNSALRGTATALSLFFLISRWLKAVIHITASLADPWDYVAGANQQFKVQAAANGSYLLTPMHVNGKCLEVLNWSVANGGAVDMWAYTGTGGNNQNWLIQPTYGGFYKIINVNNGKALEVTLGTDAAIPFSNGSAVDQYDYYRGKNQQWGFVKI